MRAAHRRQPAGTAEAAHRLPDDLLVGAEAEHDPTWWPQCVRRHQHEGWLPTERVLGEVAPAVDALGCLDADEAGHRAAITELVTPLGADLAAWTALYACLDTHEGTLAALVADVLSVRAAGTAGTAGGTPTGPTDAARGTSTEPTDAARAGFVTLVRSVPQDVRAALVPVLDVLALRDVLAAASTSAETRARIAAVHGKRALVARAMCVEQSTQSVGELLDLDDPDVNAALFRDAPLENAQRARILAGTNRRGRRGAVPLTDDLLHTLGRMSLISSRDRVMTGLESGDLRIARLILARTRLHTTVAASRMLVALWERGGPDAVRTLLDEASGPSRSGGRLSLDEEPARHARALLGASDGLDRMRSQAALDGEPARLIEAIRAGEYTIRNLLDEGIPLPWPELVAAHAARPLGFGPVTSLVARPDCPRELLLAGLLHQPNAYTARASWLRDALARGALTLPDVSAHCVPAGMAMILTVGGPVTADPEEYERSVTDDLRAVYAIDRLGDSVEAWTVAIRMLPEFSGTLLELLDTAVAVVG